MIKVENAEVRIKTPEGMPGVMTDLTMALRAVRNMAKEEGLSERDADDFVDRCVRLSRASEEELEKEAAERSKQMLGTLLSSLFGGGVSLALAA